MTAPQAMPTTADGRSDASQRLLPAGLVFSDTPSRIVASFLDGLIIAAFAAVPLGLLGSFEFRGGPFPDRSNFALATFIAYAVQGIYFVWFWSGGRRGSPGQRVMGIQIASAFDGRSLTPIQALKRFLGLGGWIGFPFNLPFFWPAMLSLALSTLYAFGLFLSVIRSPTKQGFHDRWAGSAAVRSAGADNRWAVRIIWIFVGLSLLEVLLLLWVFTAVPSPYLTDFWGKYIHWLWPS